MQKKKVVFRTTPWLTKKAILFLQLFISMKESAKEKVNILEYGVGGSTIWFSSFSNVNIISIEHDKSWYQKVNSYLSINYPDRKNYSIILHDRPYNEVVLTLNKTFDIILVDGRDRVMCIKNSFRYLNKKGVLMLDNSDRPKYKEAFEFLIGYPLTKTFEEWGTCWWENT